MPRRSMRFVFRHPDQDEEDEIIQKQNLFREEKHYTTMELRFPEDRKKQENITNDFFLKRSDEDENELHPLRKQYLENRLKDLDYQERQQMMQDSFTTAMYGKKDYSKERNNIMRELNGDSERQFVSERKEKSSSGPQFTPTVWTSPAIGPICLQIKMVIPIIKKQLN